jgi:general L-amino acid transport system substrate-binding protein
MIGRRARRRAGHRRIGPALALLLAALTSAAAAEPSRLDRIRERGHLVCGIKTGIPGFAMLDTRGRHTGFEIDLCRALATAIFGDPQRVEFATAQSVDVFLAEDRIDVVMRRLTWELTREAGRPMLFGPVLFYDGQGFLIRPGATIGDVAQLSGQPVCVPEQFAFAPTIERYFGTHGLMLRRVLSPTFAEAEAAFLAGRCVALTADVTELVGTRLKPGGAGAKILDEEISKEPLAPMLRDGDPGFFKLVRWSMLALVEAEELGVTAANADRQSTSPDERVRRLLGSDPGNGKALGLPEDWALRMLRAVGNYAEIYERNLGASSGLALDRGLNRLWNEGGLLYAPPLR